MAISAVQLAFFLVFLPAILSWAPKKAPLMTNFANQVSPDNVWPQYPRPQLVRELWQNLNGIWALDILNNRNEVQSSEEILVPFPVESALSGVMKHVDPSDVLRYSRQFTVPSTWSGSTILMHFDAVDWEANVTVNGVNVASHTGGYTRFTADITSAVKSGNNSVVVTVRDPTDSSYIPRGKQTVNPNGIFYTGTSGIWQTVWMEPVPKGNYIESVRVIPHIDTNTAEFCVYSAKQINEPVQVYFQNEAGEVFWGFGITNNCFQLSLSNVTQQVNLWSPNSPHLYQARVTIQSSRDSVNTYFAMRELTYGKDDKGIVRFQLNGEPIFMAGVLDQGFWPDGLYTPPSEAAILFDLMAIKNIYGMNMIRKHVKVEPERWYYWCDVMGILVEQDMPSGDAMVFQNDCPTDLNRSNASADNYFKEWSEIITSRWSHPSIVAWIPFNEGWGQFDSVNVVNFTKAMDPHRIVIGASGWCDHGVSDVIDLHVYVGPDPPTNALDNRQNRVAQLGEFAALGLKVDNHMWNPDKSFSVKMYDNTKDLSDAYNQKWQRLIDIAADPQIGYSSGVFTQTTDVETEVNGFFTYDRKFMKIQPTIWPAILANQRLFNKS